MLRVRPDAQKDPALLPSRLRIALLVLSLQESQVSQLRCCPGVPSIRSALQAPQHTSIFILNQGQPIITVSSLFTAIPRRAKWTSSHSSEECRTGKTNLGCGQRREKLSFAYAR
jgi:hypothetical protein